MQIYYLFDPVTKKVCPAKKREEALGLFENSINRRVAETTVGNFWISTVFLVINHNLTGKGPPILFETMIFYKGEDDHGLNYDCMRAATFEEAETHHREAVELCEMEVQITNEEKET